VEELEGTVAGGLAPSDEARRVDVVVFQLGTARFALPAEIVDELTRAFRFEVLPDVPPVVVGAVNLRGAVLPVFDLRPHLGLPEKAPDVTDHFVVARAGGARIVLHVDRVLELRSIAVTPIARAPDLRSKGELVSGVAPIDDGTLFVYDLSKLLSEAEARSVARALEARREEVLA
jgi:purine-binding chemotaxis protein CheW